MMKKVLRIVGNFKYFIMTNIRRKKEFLIQREQADNMNLSTRNKRKFMCLIINILFILLSITAGKFIQYSLCVQKKNINFSF